VGESGQVKSLGAGHRVPAFTPRVPHCAPREPVVAFHDGPGGARVHDQCGVLAPGTCDRVWVWVELGWREEGSMGSGQEGVEERTTHEVVTGWELVGCREANKLLGVGDGGERERDGVETREGVE
jgi:hypothetical protein